MILDNFIVEQVIGLVDVAEHNAAILLMSVLTTAPAISQTGSIALYRSPGILLTRCTRTNLGAHRCYRLHRRCRRRTRPWN
jgi:hypothetical protein